MMKHWKITLTLTLVLAVARIPFKGKTGEAASLITRTVTDTYAKAACAQQTQPFLEQAARRIVLGIECPQDGHKFPSSLITNLFQSGAPARSKNANQKKTQTRQTQRPSHEPVTAELAVN